MGINILFRCCCFSSMVKCICMQMYHILYTLERKMSMIYSPINVMMFYGILLETAIFIIIVYVPGLNNAFGARPVDILNLG